MILSIHVKTGSVLLAAVAMSFLSACSGSAPNKQSSIWDQRRGSDNIEAPAADAYKRELAELDQNISNVELSYQTEQVDSFVPDAESDVQEPEVIDQSSAESMDMIESSDSESNANSVEAELLAMPATNFTVQLFASVDIDRVYKFADQNQISAQYVVPTVRDDIIWYVLLLDVYPDYATAKDAMDEISSSVTTQPWVRSIGSVQKLIQ